MVISQYIGDKRTFAIEVRVTRSIASPWGNLRIWLDSKYIGAYEDECPMLVTLATLKRIPDLKASGEAFGCSPDVVFNDLHSDRIEGGDRYRLGLGESFDDFSVIGFCDDRNATFVWAIREDPFFTYPDYPVGVHSATVPLDFFKNAVSGFEEFIRP